MVSTHEQHTKSSAPNNLQNQKRKIDLTQIHKATASEINKAQSISAIPINDTVAEALALINKKEWKKAESILLEYIAKNQEDVMAIKALIKVFFYTKNKNAHLITLLRLASLETLSDIHRQQFYALSSEIMLLTFAPSTVQGLINILNYDDLNPRAISTNIGNYILNRYKMHQAEPNINLNDIYNDELLLTALRVIRLCDPTVERLLMTLREAMLTLTLQNQTIPQGAPPIIIGLGLQYYLNEYVSYVNETETQLLTQVIELLKTQVSQPSWTPYDSEALLLLIGMYQSFYDLPMAEKLLATPLDQWPPNLKMLAKLSLFDIARELELAQQIKTLTPVENQVSKEVQSHYEQNPYPRWNTLRVEPLDTVSKLILHNIPQMEGKLIAPFQDPQAPILIAGCGTGMQPIICAKRFPKAKVIGIDISRRSLAYAQIKVEELGLKNLDLYHGDILEAPNYLDKFHYIECSGVLHHMQDPKLGWQKLLQMLLPGGILKIAVYSSTARVDITAERDKIAKLKMEPTPKNIRLYRQALLNQKNRSKVVSMFSDFYSLSECRDLLFHQHEQCFTWEKVKEHCDSLNVKFLGLVNNSGIKAAFHEQFPNEKTTTSFTKLHEFEQKNPYVFRSMYQFLVQKPKLT